MKTKDFPVQIKDLSDEGTFEGYGSVFGNRDSYGDKVMPGAFVGSLAKHKREGSKVLMLWQHNPDEPIGVWDDLAEDAKGLWGKGQIIMETQRGREAHALMKRGAIQGLSIGYRVLKSEPDGGDILLKELDLLEISPVSFPANRRARVTVVKSDRFDALRERLVAGDLPSEREFEKGMRDAFDLSNSEAERVVRLFFKTAQGDPAASATDDTAKRLAAIARASAAALKLK